MGCLFVTFAAFFPRFAVLFIWLARPAMFEAALGSALVAVLGIVFLPFTTLMYVVLWTPAGLTGFDWVWVFLAFLIDLGGTGLVRVREPRTRRRLLQRRQHRRPAPARSGVQGGSLSLSPNAFWVLGSIA